MREEASVVLEEGRGLSFIASRGGGPDGSGRRGGGRGGRGRGETTEMASSVWLPGRAIDGNLGLVDRDGVAMHWCGSARCPAAEAGRRPFRRWCSGRRVAERGGQRLDDGNRGEGISAARC